MTVNAVLSRSDQSLAEFESTPEQQLQAGQRKNLKQFRLATQQQYEPRTHGHVPLQIGQQCDTTGKPADSQSVYKGGRVCVMLV